MIVGFWRASPRAAGLMARRAALVNRGNSQGTSTPPAVFLSWRTPNPGTRPVRMRVGATLGAGGGEGGSLTDGRLRGSGGGGVGGGAVRGGFNSEAAAGGRRGLRSASRFARSSASASSVRFSRTRLQRSESQPGNRFCSTDDTSACRLPAPPPGPPAPW